ncbi:hypothetical protein HELRODRAFT_138277, partial [Helobdella robusta]|uniref:Sex-determining region Y protein n=1 Tax=Helobdella robusta TaxID=6412 RepID=T1EIS5_HELRO
KIKRPPNSFFCFSEKMRRQFTEENPGLNQNVITKMLAKKWKTLSKKEKQKYKIEADCQNALH